MKNIFPILILSIFFVILFLSACDDTITNSDIDNVDIPDSDVSYSQHIQPVFNVKCNNSGCHNSADRAGGLSLETWAGTTADALIVFPGEPANSKLVWSVKGISGAEPMPPIGYPPLTIDQINGIETWIAEGANSN